MKTNELTGTALDWAVAKCEGLDLFESEGWEYFDGGRRPYRPSTSWAQGGPIIERERIRLDTTWGSDDGYWAARIDVVGGWWQGNTPLVAAMRCYVASKLGDEIDVPEELTK